MPIFVFPRVPVRIHQAGREAVVATPNELMLYNPLQPYKRRAIDPQGDRCEYIGVNPAVLADAFEACGIKKANRNVFPNNETGFAPFTESHASCESKIYLTQRLLFSLASSADKLDSMALEEMFISFLPDLVKCSNGKRIESSQNRAMRLDRGKELSQLTREIIALRFKQPISLESIAAELECSVFHLCRTFKRETGHSIHQSILRMRLFSSLEQVQDSDRSLTHVALDHQFSSHSHFTNAFRRLFGITPGSLRGKYAFRYQKLLKQLQEN